MRIRTPKTEFTDRKKNPTIVNPIYSASICSESKNIHLYFFIVNIIEYSETSKSSPLRLNDQQRSW